MTEPTPAATEPDVTLDEIHRLYPKDLTDDEWRRQIARRRMERAAWQAKQKARGRDE